jgi:hypothetical protein
MAKSEPLCRGPRRRIEAVAFSFVAAIAELVEDAAH